MKVEFIDIKNRCSFNSFLENNSFTTVEHYFLLEEIESNYSFIVYFNNKPALFFPLVLENINNTLKGAFKGVSLPSPLFDGVIESNKIRKRIIKYALDIIDSICLDNQVESLKINFLTTLININEYQILHTLLKKNFYYLDIFDIGFLDLNEVDIYRKFSKGLKSDIKRWKNTLEINYFNYGVELLTFENFINELEYYKGSDLKILYTFYIENKLDFITIKQDNKNCGYLLFLIDSNNKIVNYYSAFKLEEINIPIHAIGLYYAIEKYISKGYSQLELGILSSSVNLGYIPSIKQQKISNFKNAFGLKLKHMSVYQKFFSMDDYFVYVDNQLQKLINSYGIEI